MTNKSEIRIDKT